MAAVAVLLVLHVEGLLAVVALAAEVALRDLGHVDLVRPLGHLKDLIVTGRALDALGLHVQFMAEDHRFGVLGREGQVASAHLLGERAARYRTPHCNQQNNDPFPHNVLPLPPAFPSRSPSAFYRFVKEPILTSAPRSPAPAPGTYSKLISQRTVWCFIPDRDTGSVYGSFIVGCNDELSPAP